MKILLVDQKCAFFLLHSEMEELLNPLKAELNPICLFLALLSKAKVIPLQARCGQMMGRGIAILFHDRGTRRG